MNIKKIIKLAIERTSLYERLKNVHHVNIEDYSDYIPGKTWNGGGYTYTNTYIRVGADSWELSMSTSAEFEYCSYCGDFGHSADNCHTKANGWDVPTIISTSDLVRIIQACEQANNDWDGEHTSYQYDVRFVTNEEIENIINKQ